MFIVLNIKQYVDQLRYNKAWGLMGQSHDDFSLYIMNGTPCVDPNLTVIISSRARLFKASLA